MYRGVWLGRILDGGRRVVDDDILGDHKNRRAEGKQEKREGGGSNVPQPSCHLGCILILVGAEKADSMVSIGDVQLGWAKLWNSGDI